MSDIFTKSPRDITYSDVELWATTEPVPREGTNIDFKSEFCDGLLASIAAMANTEGGLILLGVDQKRKDGVNEIQWPPGGVDGKFVRMEKLASQCHEWLRPDYTPTCQPIQIPRLNDKYILVIRIDPRLAYRPIWHKHKGILIRMESSNLCADLDTIRRLLLEPKTVLASESVYNQLINESRNSNARGSWLSLVAQTANDKRYLGSEEKLLLMGYVSSHFLAGGKCSYYSNRSNIRILFPSKNEPDFSAYFDAKGTFMLSLLTTDKEIKLGWLLYNLHKMMKYAFKEDLKDIFGEIGSVAVTLSNWPEGGFSTDGLFESIRPDWSPRGYSTTEHYIISGSDDLWDLVLQFCDALLGEAGFMDYERKLKMLPMGEYPWLT